MKYLPIWFVLFAVMVSPLRAEEDSIVFDEKFKEKLQDGWYWIREVPDQHVFRNDAMEIKMEPNPSEGIRNILVRKVPKKEDGPFVIQLEVDSEMPFADQYQQVGLYWLNGDELRFKFVKEFIDGELYVFPGKKPLKTQRVTLRLLVDGNNVIGFCKPHGTEKFEKVYEAALPDRNEEDRISIQCWQGPQDGKFWTRLIRFQILRPE